MAEDNENNTKQWNPDDYLINLIYSICDQNDLYNDYSDSAVNLRKQSYIDEIKAAYPEIKNTDIHSLKTLLLTETNNKLDNKITDEERLETNKKIELLEEYINLVKLVQIATTYVDLVDKWIQPMDQDWTQHYLATYKYEDIIKIYEAKIEEELKNQRIKRANKAQKKAQQKAKIAAQEAATIAENSKKTKSKANLLSIFNFGNRGGRRSTQKRKKTIRKKTKNKKRTRRFR